MPELFGANTAPSTEQGEFLATGSLSGCDLCLLPAGNTGLYIDPRFGQSIQFLLNLTELDGCVKLISPEQTCFSISELPAVAMYASKKRLPFITHQTIESKPGIRLLFLDLMLFRIGKGGDLLPVD
ncbi:hypothetical protein ABKW04_21845 (plasmid) [Enterobacter hormaechei]